MSIYRNEKGKEEILLLYDQQLKRMSIPYSDRVGFTSFGNIHLIETGNLKGLPLLVFHGGNAITAYNLLECDFLMEDFHVYAVDTITSLRRRNGTMKRRVNMKQKQCYIFLDVRGNVFK